MRVLRNLDRVAAEFRLGEDTGTDFRERELSLGTRDDLSQGWPAFKAGAVKRIWGASSTTIIYGDMVPKGHYQLWVKGTVASRRLYRKRCGVRYFWGG